MEFCRLTGREISTNTELTTRLKAVYDTYVPFSSVGRDAVPATLVKSGLQEAFYVGGRGKGIVLDEIYVTNFAAILRALVTSEGAIDIAVPLTDAVAASMQAQGDAIRALMLRHERVSGLYVSHPGR
jgi:hypothetical protein